MLCLDLSPAIRMRVWCNLKYTWRFYLTRLAEQTQHSFSSAATGYKGIYDRTEFSARSSRIGDFGYYPHCRTQPVGNSTRSSFGAARPPGAWVKPPAADPKFSGALRVPWGPARRRGEVLPLAAAAGPPAGPPAGPGAKECAERAPSSPMLKWTATQRVRARVNKRRFRLKPPGCWGKCREGRPFRGEQGPERVGEASGIAVSPGGGN